MSGKPIGFAHRGGAAHGPDNTIATFAEALRRGATGLETDAWVTADGEVVLDHDGVLRASRLARRPMSQVRRDELPAHIPTLAELYAACGTGFDVAIDVKSTTTAVAVAEQSRRLGTADRVWLVAPHSAMLRDVDFEHRMVTVTGRTMRGPRRRAAFRGIREAGMAGVNARWPWWRTAYVDEAHALGLLAFAYDVQQPSSFERILGRGVDAVFSDHVDRMVAALAEPGWSPR